MAFQRGASAILARTTARIAKRSSPVVRESSCVLRYGWRTARTPDRSRAPAVPSRPRLRVRVSLLIQGESAAVWTT